MNKEKKYCGGEKHETNTFRNQCNQSIGNIRLTHTRINNIQNISAWNNPNITMETERGQTQAQQ